MLWMQKALWWHSHSIEGREQQLLSCKFIKRGLFFFFFKPLHTDSLWLYVYVLLEQIEEILIPAYSCALCAFFLNQYFILVVSQWRTRRVWCKNSNWVRRRRSKVHFWLDLFSELIWGLVQGTSIQTLNQQSWTDGNLWWTSRYKQLLEGKPGIFFCLTCGQWNSNGLILLFLWIVPFRLELLGNKS